MEILEAITDKFLRRIVTNLDRREITLSMVAQAEQERKNCKCPDRHFIQHRIEGEYGRDYIEQSSRSDQKHQINSMGRLEFDNAYGEIASYCPDCKKIYPVICQHGGSMWLCRECAEGIIGATLLDRST